jgi:hypothetical protein
VENLREQRRVVEQALALGNLSLRPGCALAEWLARRGDEPAAA